MSNHGGAMSDILLPRSRFYHGPYGRMFRNLPPYEPRGGEQELIKIGKKMHKKKEEDKDNSTIPAGYTYFGQFVDHDITFDPTSSLQRQNDPNKLRNFRTPRFDLDSLYGGGPNASPFMYDHRKQLIARDGFPCYLLIGTGKEQNIDTKEPDLPRNCQGRALIGDLRNDENIIISQMQLAFIQFHNQVVADLRAKAGDQALSARLFAEAQRIVRWHYQWVVVHDFLKRIVGEETYERVLPDPEVDPRKPRLRFYKWREQPFMPVEFSAAAFRMGHSMVRNRYDLNDKSGTKNLLILDPSKKALNGFRFLPKDWSIQWNRFLEIHDDEGNLVEPQLSRRINATLTHSLKELPFTSDTDRKKKHGALATRNLLRGWRMDLPAGQAVAKAMGFSIPAELDPHDNDPLEYYILKEAEVLGHKGEHLGPVGGTIVAEVFLGLLAGDPNSYLNIDPLWSPEKESALNAIKEKAERIHAFELRDIVRYAGVPLFKKDIPPKIADLPCHNEEE